MGYYVGTIRDFGQPSWVESISTDARTAISEARSTLGTIKEAGTEFEGQINALTSKITDIKLPPLPELPTLQAPDGLGSVAGELPAMSSHALPKLQDIPDAEAGEMPEFKIARPVLDLQTVPAIGAMVMPAEPTLDEWALPADPDVEKIPLPVLADITLPPVPQMQFPTFSVSRPGAPAVNVDDMVMKYEVADYVSPWLDKIQSEVLAGLQNGTGLSAANEDAIFGRARDRAMTEQRRAEQTAMTQFTARGFTMPAGPMMAAVEQARQAGRDSVAEVSREAAIKRAEWEIEHYRFLLGKMGDFEGMSQQFFLGQQRMLLDAAQAQLQSKVQTYNVLATIFQATMEGYKIDTEVYKAQIEAEVQRLRAYESQIAGVKAQSELNQQQVMVYSERQKALALHVEIYKARIEALNTLEQRNLARIGVFKARVEAASSQMSAAATRAQAIATSNQAAAAPVQLYQADVSAYGERVRAYATQTEAKVSAAQLVAERNRDQLAAFQASVEADRQRVQSYVTRMEAQVGKYRADTEYMRATADIAGRVAETSIRSSEVMTSYALRSTEVLSKATEAAAQVVVGRAKLAQDKAISTGQVYASMAASAFGALHASHSSQNSTVLQNSLQESHDYNYKE